MLSLSDRIDSLDKLGKELEVQLQQYINDKNTESRFADAVRKTIVSNSWFTEQSVISAIEAIIPWLNRNSLEQWLANYPESSTYTSNKTIGVVMAGNIPLVNFHDVLSIWLSGHKLIAKLSSQDSFLFPYFTEELIKIDSQWNEIISITNEKIHGFDAVIATGSNNTSRYFEFYFQKYPHIIRKNRSSAAVIHGDETAEEMLLLGKDVFAYFGLGCRNVSHILLPKEFDPTKLLSVWNSFSEVVHHHKYHNNYDYQKAILLINRIPFYDSGYLLLKEDEQLYSPVSVLHYHFYDDQEDIAAWLSRYSEQIQCILNQKPMPKIESIPFGKAQQPGLMDYPDHVDVMKFLYSL